MTPTRDPQLVARSAKTAAYSALGALALVGVLALTGYTINVNSPGSHSSMMGADKEDARGTLSDADIMFLQMMIPHHQQAVDMGTLAETRASNPEVKALAAQIKAEQAPEIAQMSGWLTDAGLPTTSSMDMGHGMDGVLSDAQMTALTNATGTAFDKLYLEGMIGHHEGAIKMVSMLKNSDNPSTKQLGDKIVASQTAQIAQMKALLAKL
jgi:uncharacterized protein (DUF305 family)